MITLVLEREPTAVAVEVTDEQLNARLADGRSISVPLEWYPRLAHATASERNHDELLGQGSAAGWLERDEHFNGNFISAKISNDDNSEA